MPGGEDGATPASAAAWLASPDGRACVLAALAEHDLPAGWATPLASLLATTTLDAGDLEATARTACANVLEGVSGRAALLALDVPAGAEVPAPPIEPGADALDTARLRIPAIARGADWMAAAALAALAIRAAGATTGPDVPPSGPDEAGRPVPAAALWYAGRRDCFTDEPSAQEARALERRARACDEVDAVLRAAGAPSGPIAPRTGP